jgi:hypothetical protein
MEFNLISRLKSKEKLLDLIHNSDVYELFLMKLLNQTSFFNELEHILKEEQSNGNDDFKEFDNKGNLLRTFEAILLTSHKIIEPIINTKGVPKEYQDFIRNKIKKVYKVSLKKKNKKGKENIIIFNIFPIKEFKFENAKTQILMNSNDFWETNYREYLKEIDKNNIKNLYVVSLNSNYKSENTFYVRKIVENKKIVDKIEFVHKFEKEKFPFESYTYK